ncbi:MAG: glycosyltransferase [Muricauda sp. TMED12]|nr:MAG: glycosyltransferase [Muricauda sp. TMED12]
MTPPPRQGRRICYLFKGGRHDRLSVNGTGPSEFFYGLPEMREQGLDVQLIEESVFGLGKRANLFWEAFSRITHTIVGIHAYAVLKLRQNFRKFGTVDAIVSVNNTYGLALSYIKLRQRNVPRVVFIAMGLLPLRPSEIQRRLFNLILKRVTLATISKSEQAHLNNLLPSCKVQYVPFGVDQDFWTPDRRDLREHEPHYILSIGNDPNRDYACLISAWRTDYPRLQLVTRISLPAVRLSNIDVRDGDWRTQALTDSEVRDLIRGAAFVVLPIRETIQPSGQSACLQAMACGKAVIMSNIAGLWDTELMQDGENCILVPPGDPTRLREAIEYLLEHPQEVENIGRRARQTVENHFNTQLMANAIRKLIEEDQP